MTRIGRKILWLMVFIGFIAALVVFFAVATSGFKNWNGNEWFDYWGQGKPVTSTAPSDTANTQQRAVRLNGGVAVVSDEPAPYYQLIDTHKYEQTDGEEFSSKCYGWYRSINKNYDKFEYILELQRSQPYSDSDRFGLLIQNMTYSAFELDYGYMLDNSAPYRLLNMGEYSPMGYTFSKEFPLPLFECSPDYSVYFTVTNERAFLSCVPMGEGQSTYENSLNHILFEFGEYYEPFHTLLFNKLNTRISYNCCDYVSETLNLYTEMDAPTKEGYTFTGWYYDEACTRPYKGEPITADTNLYAGFVINKYTVTFDMREIADTDDPNAGDTYFHTIEVEYGQTASYTPAAVVGKTFLGWYDNSGAKYENTPIKQDTEFIGHWANVRYTITFDVNGGDGTIPSITVEHGTVAELPVPTRTGYGFMGWTCTNNPDFESSFPVTSDLNLRAEWKRNVFTVTFYVDNTVFKTIQVEYGQTLGSATIDSGISTALVVGFENINTTTAASNLNEFEVIDDVAVYLSEAPVIPDEPNNSAVNKQMNKVVKFFTDNWILITCCAVGGIILLCLISAAFKRKKR